MSYGIALVFEGVSEADYWAVNSKLGIGRDGSGEWPEGMKSHVGGPTPNGWVVPSVKWVCRHRLRSSTPTRSTSTLPPEIT